MSSSSWTSPRNKEIKRIDVKLSGVTTPPWSPYGKRWSYWLRRRFERSLHRLARRERTPAAHPGQVCDLHGLVAVREVDCLATDRGGETTSGRWPWGNIRLPSTISTPVHPGARAGGPQQSVSPPVVTRWWLIAFVSDRKRGDATIFLYTSARRGLPAHRLLQPEVRGSRPFRRSSPGPRMPIDWPLCIREGGSTRLHAVEPRAR